MLPDINIKDFNYCLDEDRIAKYPLAERDSSKLLVYRNGGIDESVFRNLPDFIEDDSLMIFNDTKVVPARLFFRKETGAHIEIFCLKPVDPAEYNQSFSCESRCTWMCVIGNSKKWKGTPLKVYDPDGLFSEVDLTARLVSKDLQTGLVEFSWSGGIPFSRVLEMCGRVPIPPYLNRETEDIDTERYQTLYAKYRGSVAAPTAGLHFTRDVLERLSLKGIEIKNVCLHVGAGTFLPVKSENVSAHTMHREPFVVTRDVLERILDANKSVTCSNKKVVAVGTTSVRTLESLYYVGVDILEGNEPREVRQWCPYEREYPYSTQESLSAILAWMDRTHIDELKVETRIIIVPGFRFRIVDRMVTNFHQPQSTLLLLVSAFVDSDWRTIYDYALSHNFRFLSYGDSSLLFRR